MNALKSRRKGMFVATAIFGGLFSTAAFASPITGVLNISGGVSVSMSTIDFLPLGGGTGTAAADAFTNTGSFAVLNTGNPAAEATGTIKDMTGGPVVGTVDMPDFLGSFALAPNIALDLNFINPGIYSPAECGTDVTMAAAGNTCSPPGSPFNLSDIMSGNSISTIISLGLSGTARNTTTGEVSAFTGTLSTQIDHTSYEAILGVLEAGGSEATTYSGSFTVSAVPEPGTISMIFAGLGMLCISLIGKRVRARHQ